MVAASRVKTNWLLLDDLDFWDEFTTKAINDSDTEDYFKQIDQAIDDKLAETIKWLDSDEAKEYFQQEAEYQEEVFEALEDKWDDILSGEIASADELLDRIYEHGKQQGYSEIREKIRYTDADRQALQFAKDYNFHLIQKLDDNLRDAVKKQVIQAVASGEHPYELAPKIQELGVQPLPGSTLSARHRAVMIARTETARVQNTGIIQSYVNEGFTEVNILTAEDSSVCRLCLANAYEFNTDEIILENRGADRTHKIADMNSNSWVPLHPNCRCTYVAVWDSRGEAPENPESVNLTPVDANIYDGQGSLDFYFHREDKFTDIVQSKRIAKELGFSYDKKNGNEIFRDFKNNVEILFEKEFLKKLDEMSSRGVIHYSKYDVLKMYKDSNILLKNASTEILFSIENKSDNDNSTGFYDPNTRNIVILPKAFTVGKNEHANLQFTLYHEMVHALDHSVASKREQYGLSRDNQDFKKVVIRDESYQIKEYGETFEVSKHAEEEGYKESFADSMAMIVFEVFADKTSAVLILSNGEKVSFDEWKKRFPHRYQYCKNILDGTYSY